MNLVALWIAKSAPCPSARCSSGVANVPSTATSAPRSCAPAQQRVELGDLDERVARRLDVQQPRAIAGREGGGGVGRVGARELDPSRVRVALQQAARPRVTPRGGDHLRAGRKRLEHGGDRGHARAERDRGTAFERADGGLEGRPAGRALLARIAGLVEVRRREERRVQRLALDACRPSCVDRDGLRSVHGHGRHPTDIVDNLQNRRLRSPHGPLAAAVRCRRRDRGRRRGRRQRRVPPRRGRRARSCCSSATSSPAARPRRPRAACARSSRTR